MGTMQYFHDHQVFQRSLNAKYVALIPKRKGAEELRDRRPISLISEIYKIIAKVLTERMKKVMDSLVNKYQMAFVKGRQIMDAVLIANECVDTRIRGEVASLMCKLDIEKTYDHVNLDYLLSALKKWGLGIGG